MSHVSPARFDSKTSEEVKVYGLDWSQEIDDDTIASVLWLAEPNGLALQEQTLDGALVTVKISGGVPGTTYHVRCRVTLTGTGETLEAFGQDSPGIYLDVVGWPVAGGRLGTVRDDYGRGPY